MPRSCRIITGSRLHFGPLAWKPAKGRDLRVEEIEAFSGRPAEWLDRFRITMEEQPLAHCGFGSGTQRALATALAASLLDSGRAPDPLELARLAKRGLRSAIGLHGFQLGGLIVDAGKRSPDDIGQLAARLEFPHDWLFVLLTPAQTVGLMGEEEARTLQRLPSFSEDRTHRLSRLVLTEVLPSVQSRDFDRFATALDEYGVLVGEAFEHCQGGVVHSSMLPVWHAFRDRGQTGMAQSSWGPTLAIVCNGARQAQEVSQQARRLDPTLQLIVTAAQNDGARVELD
jgi:beta-ribofuranosylaminobenzene 5'-phosphate synthase